MHFDLLEDYRSRYAGTYVVYKGKAYHVESVTGENDNVKLELFNRDKGEIITVLATDPDLKLDNFVSGYLKTGDGTLIYANRRPLRQWKQGFLFGRYNFKQCSVDKNRKPLHLRKNWEEIQQILLPEFDTFGKETGKVQIYSRCLASDATGFMYYRGSCVGAVTNGQVGLWSASGYLKDHLARKGIPCEVYDLDSNVLKQTFTGFDLMNFLGGDKLDEFRAMLNKAKPEGPAFHKDFF